MVNLQIRSLARQIFAVIYLPHEFIHWVIIHPWCEDVSLDILPDIDGSPPGQVSGRLKATVPESIIKLDALGPLLVFGALAPLVGMYVSPDSIGNIGFIAVSVIYIIWMLPSQGDMAIYSQASLVRKRRQLPGIDPKKISSRRNWQVGVITIILSVYVPVAFLYF